jgi:hypothetical protein
MSKDDEIEDLKGQLADASGRIIALEFERDGLRRYANQLQNTIDSMEQMEAGFVVSLSDKDLGKVRRLNPSMLMNRYAHDRAGVPTSTASTLDDEVPL